MKIQLTIETPEDDDLHYTRIARALRAYCARVAFNNHPAVLSQWMGGPWQFWPTAEDAKYAMLGCDGRPHVFIPPDGCAIITERRLDLRWSWLRWPVFKNGDLFIAQRWGGSTILRNWSGPRKVRILAWWRHNRTILNLRLGRRYLQVWAWGARIMPSEDGRSFWALHQVLWWRPQ